ncbi:ribosomal protein S18-alanine N-acetyltransferase [Fictibacillus terranigra]|uniref:[Ribosomal protein bS18]-alanine N-acetyltransferase n=1 Tax=Fictibacillus terranigra TaxID=3058424 RepID=A0ABT8ED31_9BACL|nr:ribosomal protein S18-alanine N-acetyltransferase [Fictibacillus sp. CENA-BCM004]MDN4075838.1 ribosomal protein S18-alanine N-acetyltransferase [Fictibacillus sp. CENA-BCM004]
MEETYTFRLATVSDLQDIIEIEHASFTLPWTHEAFYNEIVHNQFAYYLLLEADGKTVGYCGVWVIIDDAHITNVAIRPEYRGRKLGEAIMKQAMRLAKRYGSARLSLEVRVSNYVAQNLYRKLGFQDGGIRKNYYSDNGEDALVMWVML